MTSLLLNIVQYWEKHQTMTDQYTSKRFKKVNEIPHILLRIELIKFAKPFTEILIESNHS